IGREEDPARGFDLGQAPLMRLSVVELGGGRQRVSWTMHHLLLDGWSTAIVLDDLARIHQGLATPARRPYRDYVGWVRSQDRERARAYWRGLLAGFGAANELPLDRRAAGFGEEAPRELELNLSETETARLQELCRRHRWTLSTLLQGAWAVVLGRCSGQPEV